MSGEGSRHPLRTPTLPSSPTPTRSSASRRHLQLLTAVLVLVTATLAYAAFFDLDSAAEWIVFGAIVATVIGAMIAVHRP